MVREQNGSSSLVDDVGGSDVFSKRMVFKVHIVSRQFN